jgi:ParB family chromosome partitioning protein
MSDRPGKGLGMGLQALLGEARPAAASEARAGGVREIEIARIRPNPNQPRTHFDEDALNELAESIAERGVLQPILIRPDGQEAYEIIAGERRWRAAQRAQLHTIPAVIRDQTDEALAAELALIENIQREDLNAIEEAEGYRQLINRYGHGADEVGKLVHKSRSHVANLLRLLDLPEIVKQSLLKGDISMGHARAVLTAPDPAALAEEVVAKGLSVRQTEARAKAVKKGPRELVLTEDRKVDADIAALERQLGDMLGLKVQVANKGQGGTVSLHYSSLDQLDMICQRLSGEAI